jgi:MFS family permease
VGTGALVFAPLINFLIQNLGWRTTLLTFGILFGSVVVIATLDHRPAPRDTGVTSKGRNGIVLPAEGQVRAGTLGYASWAFAAVLFVSVVGIFTFQFLTTHMVPHATDASISASAAAAALGLMGGFSIPGRILSGIFSTRMGWHRLLSLAYFGTAGSMLLLWFVRDVWMLYFFSLFYGLFHGVRISAQIGVLPEIFGMRSLGELIGITSAAGQLISAMAPYAAGALFDATGSYSFAFLLIVLLLSAGGVVAGALKRIAARTPVLDSDRKGTSRSVR